MILSRRIITCQVCGTSVRAKVWKHPILGSKQTKLTGDATWSTESRLKPGLHRRPETLYVVLNTVNKDTVKEAAWQKGIQWVGIQQEQAIARQCRKILQIPEKGDLACIKIDNRITAFSAETTADLIQSWEPSDAAQEKLIWQRIRFLYRTQCNAELKRVYKIIVDPEEREWDPPLEEVSGLEVREYNIDHDEWGHNMDYFLHYCALREGCLQHRKRAKERNHHKTATFSLAGIGILAPLFVPDCGADNDSTDRESTQITQTENKTILKEHASRERKRVVFVNFLIDFMEVIVSSKHFQWEYLGREGVSQFGMRDSLKKVITFRVEGSWMERPEKGEMERKFRLMEDLNEIPGVLKIEQIFPGNTKRDKIVMNIKYNY